MSNPRNHLQVHNVEEVENRWHSVTSFDPVLQVIRASPSGLYRQWTVQHFLNNVAPFMHTTTGAGGPCKVFISRMDKFPIFGAWATLTAATPDIARAWADYDIKTVEELRQALKEAIEGGHLELMAHTAVLIDYCATAPEFVRPSLRALKNEVPPATTMYWRRMSPSGDWQRRGFGTNLSTLDLGPTEKAN